MAIAPSPLLPVTFAGLALAISSACATAQPAPLTLTSVEPDPVFDDLFAPLERGYLGADGAASVQLAPGRILWIFGDTMLGTSYDGARKGPMVRNSIAVHDVSQGMPGTVEYFWNIEDRLLGDFFRPESHRESHWFWPGAGVNHDGKLYLFLTKLEQGEGDDGFAFETVDCTLFRVHNPESHPDEWMMDQVNLGFGDQHFNINVAAHIEDEHVYLLGYDDGPSQSGVNRAAFLARIALDALDEEQPGSKVEFWSEGAQWRSTPDALEHLFRPGTTESGLYYDAAVGRYLTATMDPFTPHMYLMSAEKLTGPWVKQHVYDIPGLLNREDDNYHAYTPRVHPLLSPGDGTVVMTYVINTKDFWSAFSDLEIYYPRFVRLEIAP